MSARKVGKLWYLVEGVCIFVVSDNMMVYLRFLVKRLVYLWCLVQGWCIFGVLWKVCVSDGRLVYLCGVSIVPSGRLVYLCCVRKYVGVLVVYTSILVCLWWCRVEG